MASDLNENKVARTANEAQEILNQYFDKARKGIVTPEDTKVAQIAIQTWGAYIKFVNSQQNMISLKMTAIRQLSRSPEDMESYYRVSMPQIFPVKQITEGEKPKE